MDIVQEKIGELNAVLKIKVTKTDYQEKYDNALKSYRKKIQLPGFRAGMVPVGVIKKRFGKSILVEEVNKILNESLQKYLKEQNLQLLGQPMPKEDENDDLNWDHPEEMEFQYEIGFTPEFSMDLSGKDKLEYYEVKVDEALVDKQVKDLARRYGTLSEPELSEDNDLLVGEFIELDMWNREKEEGKRHESTVSIEFVENAKSKKKLIGLKKGDQVTLNPKKVSRDNLDLSQMLGISLDEAKKVKNNYKFVVKEVKRLIPTKVDQHFFDKIFGQGVVNDLQEFKKRVKEDLVRTFSNDSDQVFREHTKEKLIKKLKLKLPDDFLKRWIKANSEEPITEENFEQEYTAYASQLKWQLVENKIVKENNLQVKQEEAIAYTQKLLSERYAQYGMALPEEADFQQTVMKIIQHPEEGRKIFDILYGQKVMEHIKNTAKIVSKEVSYDEFVKLASAKK